MNPTTPTDSAKSTNTTIPALHRDNAAMSASDHASDDRQALSQPGANNPASRTPWLPPIVSGAATIASDRIVSAWRSLPRYWRWFTGEGHGGEPSARMFSGIRLRLTLWYCAALAALLLISGTAIYEGTQYALMSPVGTTLSQSALSVKQAWQAQVTATPTANPNPNDPYGFDPRRGCYVPKAVLQSVPYVECFTTEVGLVTLPHAVLPPSFNDTALETKALSSPNGQATAVIEGGNGLGAIQCYALVVHDPTNSTSVLGVVQLGYPIQGQLTALHTLLIMLLLVGALTLLGAALSGLWLANRAMQPARMAFDRQQAFIADAAHELRTPLTLMRADAEVLLRGRNRLQVGDAELLNDIVGETAHMGALTTNLLTLARLDAGAQRIERDVVDLSEIASQTLHRAQALADARQIAVTNATQPRDRPTLVVGDQALLQQVALILLDNALKYTLPGGSVIIRVTRVGWQAALEVKDTGVGVAAEDLRRLGERFYRVDKARSREMGGAGLGLAIARGVAAAHQGALTLTSQPGQGTTATLTLPAATLAGQPTGPNRALSGAEDAGNAVDVAREAEGAPPTTSTMPIDD